MIDHNTVEKERFWWQNAGNKETRLDFLQHVWKPSVHVSSHPLISTAAKLLHLHSSAWFCILNNDSIAQVYSRASSVVLWMMTSVYASVHNEKMLACQHAKPTWETHQSNKLQWWRWHVCFDSTGSGNHRYFMGYLFFLLCMICWMMYGCISCE